MSQIKELQKECKDRIDFLFRYLPCAVCISKGKHRAAIPHHIIFKSQDGSLKYEVWNLLPMCSSHHTIDPEISAHNSNLDAVDNFFNWLERNLPLHYQWFEEHKDDPVKKLYLGDYEKIIENLNSLSRYDVERIVFEK